MADFGHAIGVPASSEPGKSPGGGSPVSTPPAYGNPPAHGSPPPYDQAPTAGPDLDLETAHAQARARAETGDLTGARTMLEEALAAGELRRGPSDPALVPLMVDVATLARRLGNLTEAANQLRRAYGIVVAASGPQHPTSLSIEGRLAAVLYRLGESTEAYDWHLADAGRRVLGEEHPAVRGAQQRLAAVAQTSASAPPAAAPFAPPAAVAYDTPPSSPVPPVGPQPAVAPPPPPAAPPSMPVAAPSAPFAPPPPPAAQPSAPAAPPSMPVAAPSAPFAPPSAPVPPPPPEPAVGGLYGSAIEGDIWEAGEATVRTRRPGSGNVILAASLGAVILVVVVVVALAVFAPPPAEPAAQGPEPQQSALTVTANPTPTAPPTSPAPGNVRIVTDDGGAVTLAWSDPSSGQVPFVVSGAREGHALTAISTVPAGETTTTIYGLNINFNYCFTVAAVWSAEMVQPSMRTCTHRSNVSASSSP